MSDATTGDVVIKGYRLTEVLGGITPQLRDEIAGMWLAEGVLPPAEAQRRVAEVVLIARAPDGSLAAVNTAYLALIPGTQSRFWFYRTFIRPAHRGVWGVPRHMLRLAIEALQRHPHPEQPLGVVAIIENERLMRKGASAVIERMGMHRVGRDAQGHDVWCVRFDGVVPVAPPGLLAPPGDPS
jgi:hypothetical protein